MPLGAPFARAPFPPQSCSRATARQRGASAPPSSEKILQIGENLQGVRPVRFRELLEPRAYAQAEMLAGGAAAAVTKEGVDLPDAVGQPERPG